MLRLALVAAVLLLPAAAAAPEQPQMFCYSLAIDFEHGVQFLLCVRQLPVEGSEPELEL